MRERKREWSKAIKNDPKKREKREKMEMWSVIGRSEIWQNSELCNIKGIFSPPLSPFPPPLADS